MNRSVAPISPPPPPETEPPFYGWRYIQREGPDGTVELHQVPLTLEDVLHPQEGDVIPEKPYHVRDRGYLWAISHTRLPRLPGGLVFSDCLVNWGVPGLANHSPDISVFADVLRQPSLYVGTFQLAPSGGRCVLAIELVSRDTRNNDVDHKLEEYHQAGVPLYVIVDQKRDGGPREIVAYRDTPDGYVSVPLDARGRVLLEPLGLWLGLKDNLTVCYDAVTDEELGDYTAVDQARLAAEERERQQALARAAAEERERQQALARTAAEERLRELEAELRRLKGEQP